VVRYASSGTALEASALTSDPTTGNLGLRTTTPGAGLHIVGETTTLVSTVLLENASNGINAGSLQSNKMRGTLASPARVQAGDRLNSLTGFGYVRNAADSADALTFLAGLRLVVDVLDAQARGAGRLTVDLSSGASATPSEVLRVTSAGNLLLGTMAAGTALAKGVVVGSGSAPSGSHPADAVQLWVADRAGVAGKAALHLRTEDGTSHVLGDLSGIATLGAATLGSGASYQALTVAGSLLTVGASSVQERAQALLSSTWVTSTDATRTARLALSAYDASAAREGLRVEADGTAARLGFFGSAAVAKPTVTGSRGGNAALASALTALASLGLMTDSSTA
jgi:hypothetical protein